MAVQAATNSTLALTNLALAQAGGYSAIVFNSSGSVTSTVAVLTIDPSFTKITSGAIVTDGGDSSGCAWGDFDGDGYPDLFVGNGGLSFLYSNEHGVPDMATIDRLLLIIYRVDG